MFEDMNLFKNMCALYIYFLISVSIKFWTEFEWIDKNDAIIVPGIVGPFGMMNYSCMNAMQDDEITAKLILNSYKMFVQIKHYLFVVKDNI